jgi:Cu+-exporting ATPase
MDQTTEMREERSERNASRAITQLTVIGMTCGNCARHVTEAIQGVGGVRSASVNLENHRAAVRWKAEVVPDVPAVIRAVEAAGFEARATEERACHEEASKLAGWQLNLWIGAMGTLPLMLGEWVFGLSDQPWFRWFSLAVAGVVQIFAGAPFYRGAWQQLKVRDSNMDTLVALGSTTAFAYSIWALFSHTGAHLYFMEAAAIITLISVGHWMESRVSARASSALRELLDLAPARALRRNPDGSEVEVPVAELVPGDTIVLRPGDHVPTDAEVLEGGSSVDESMLTGESTPVEKTTGNRLYAGTVNINGHLIARVTATGDETALAQVIAAVERAQNSRAEIQRLGDRVSSVFVPIVLLIAFAAGVWWGIAPQKALQVSQWWSQYLWTPHPPMGPLASAFIIGASVLVVACPCAMGLATPAAIMAGSNAAARRGILIRDGIALEKAGTVTAVLFDKTGTLTLGKPTVAKVWEVGRKEVQIRKPNVEARTVLGEEDAELKEGNLSPVAVAAGLAQHSTHPISQAVAKLGTSSAQIERWEEVRGAGVQGQVRGEAVRLGSLRWLSEAGADIARGEQFVQEWSGQGASIVGLSINNALAALFAISDSLKPGAREMVEQLSSQGLKIYLITGDTPLAATSIAEQIGIPTENVFAEVRPEQKAELVRKLQTAGERIAFVGDGINDAPALEQADLGIAVSRASDIAREAADIILLNSEIEAIPDSLGLARATLRVIKQNLFWAFFYNAAAIPLAALGFMSPVLCAAAMGLSDLVVIGNALRLRRWGIKKFKV